ncbi:hypothetical protein OPV22_025871 [Ensete ventricosum]|uniref:Uncharacterized protein n=1 Tax=Ensete ventricosum TaxID=4639 RepID=A0AAV8QEY8_ENSVE|nr:hypothetical protein OPV22_025871 [Ensete ventricosum]
MHWPVLVDFEIKATGQLQSPTVHVPKGREVYATGLCGPLVPDFDLLVLNDAYLEATMKKRVQHAPPTSRTAL